MEHLSYWAVFLTAALALNLSPGPDLIYILCRTVAQGERIGVASVCGVCSGAFVHILGAAAGLAAIIAASDVAFTIIKYAGAVYLGFLGLRALRSAGSGFEINGVPPVTAWQAFRQGVLIDVLNPKVAIFFLAFLPQFVRPDAGHPSLQIIGLGALVVLVAFMVELLFLFAAARVTRFFRTNRRSAVLLDKLLGSVLIGLGIRLAFTTQTA